MKRMIILNGKEVYYELTYKNVKNLNVRIKSDKSVCVSANRKLSQKRIDEFLITKADFILSSIEKFDLLIKEKPQEIKYVDGDDIKFLGEYKKLCVIEGCKNDVFFDGYIIYLTVKNTEDFSLKEKTLSNWKKQKCIEIVTELSEKTYEDFKQFNLTKPKIKFRKMVSCWGSCQPTKSVITFNTDLINSSKECIEYVVYHEFTHFLEPNHSKNFYEKLSYFIPDWKKRKTILNGGKYSGDL